MALDYTRVSAVKFIPPSEKKDIGVWLDMTRSAPEDTTKRQLYYKGFMSNQPLYVLSPMEPLPYGAKKPNGIAFGVNDYRILVVFDKKPYDVCFETPQAVLGSKSAQHNNKTVALHLGYAISGIYPTSLEANDKSLLKHVLWLETI